ncbi:MAG: alanine--glyoxylate aminotransferase family protein [Candidatus Omnitrophica bacterium]|nr:alanine--glyoxylate aminotransferase family protein [Candidatus Omnitrophota bacterium]
MKMKKNHLLTPGPTQVPTEVLLSMSKPTIHHRTPEFMAIFKEMNENLKYVFQTQNDIFTFASSGTGAMEATVANLLSAGDTAICVQSGKFGERWTEICKAYSVKPVVIDVEWGYAVDPAAIKKAINENKEAKVVFTTLCETSTGVLTDIKAIAEITKNTDVVIVTDAISALGGVELKTDEWGIDVVVCGSQKSLMIPPGLAFCSVSKKAWKLVEASKSPRYYFDMRAAKKALDKDDTAYTPAVTLCLGLNQALKMIKSETLEKAIARQSKLATALRIAVVALGLKVYAKNPSDVVTSISLPETINGGTLVKTMREVYGVGIAGGQDHLKGKIIRIATMGYMNEFDVIIGVSCLEIVLKKMGYEFEAGIGVGAVEKELLK